MCTLFFFFYFSDTNTPHRRNWCQLPLHIARCPSRANGSAPVPAPMVAIPFRRLLTFVRPTPVPPTLHQVHMPHLSLVFSNQPDNGGAPVMSLPFRRSLTSVRHTPVPPTPYPVHPTHPSHTCKIYVYPSSHYDPIYPIQPIQSHQSSQYNPYIAISSDTAIRSSQ